MSLAAAVRQRTAKRCRVLAAFLAATLLLLVAGPAADAASKVPAAPAIRSASNAAKTSLSDAWRFVARKQSAYRAALAAGAAKADEAYRIASAAAWPPELADERAKLLSDLSTTLTNVTTLATSKKRAKASRIRRVLAPEISRLSVGITLLETIIAVGKLPDPKPLPVPVPTPEPLPTYPGTIGTLTPGDGFTAVTPQPDAVGTGPGSDAKAIARWDVVPYQTVTTKIPVGVVAFHIAGIEAVDFSLNGGPWLRVVEMTQNPLTRVWEYSVYVDPAELPDGLLEVRAVVRPKKGLARVLAGPYDEGLAAKSRGEHSLFCYANAQGTLPTSSVWADAANGDNTTGDGSEAHPFQTLNHAYYVVSRARPDVSGLTVFLKPGEYDWPASWEGIKENAQYVTVAGAPGQARTAARINTVADQDHNRGLDARRVCIRNLTVDTVTLGSETPGCLIWVDGCELHSYGLSAYPGIFMEAHWGLGIWLTRPIIHDMGNATGEYRFMRDYELYNIGEAAVRDLCGMAINGTVRDFRFSRPNAHCDLIQFFLGFGANGEFENVIVYGFKSRNVGAVAEGVQGLFIRNYSTVPSHKDMAFVNCDIETSGNSQLLHSVSHLLIWHCNFMPNSAAGGGGSLLIRDDPPDSPQTVLHNFSLRNSVLSFFSNSCTVEPVVSTPPGGETWADQNHVVDGPAAGTNATYGSTLADLFLDAANGYYEPSPVSPLLGRLSELLVPCDVNGRKRTTPDTVGANVLPPE